MINSVNFGTLTRVEKSNTVSNPISNSTSFSANNFFAQKRDEKEYQVANETVAYANPFSFINNTEDSNVSAFDA